MISQKPPLWSLPCFEEQLAQMLCARNKITLSPEGMIVAAVLVPLFINNGRPYVLLTERSDLVEHHRGEISFPGGKFDPTDPDLKSCALRETAEEIGMDPAHVRIVGELDDFYTVATRFLVAPFVGMIPYPYEFRPSAREIAGLLSVPLEVFFDPVRRTEEIWTINDQPIEVISYRWKGYNIWGATARIMKHFTELIDAWQLDPGSCAN
ncbi:MAG TPA: CoA pyrophosphatase [Desulfomonilaceae bacterium]|nr:CoA pyrophosphatase [Desulfomonilaceae bacterium]